MCPRGFQQTAGIDYDPNEITAYTPQLETCMWKLAVQVRRNQFTIIGDVPKAFAKHGDIQEDLYTEIPDGMTKDPTKVLKLVK